MKRLVAAPTVDFKVMVESKDLSGFQLPREMHQASISEIHFAIAIFAKQPLQRSGGLRQLQGNMKHTSPDIFQDCLGGSGWLRKR